MAAMTSESAAFAKPTKLPELVLTRVFDAPRELLFELWVDPLHLALWWGPGGFTNPVCEGEPREGGAVRIDMQGPDGTVYPMTAFFEEIVRPDKLVFVSQAMHDAAGKPQLEVRNTVTFAAVGKKTRLTLRAAVVTAGAGTAGALSGMEAGWTQSLERLAAEAARPLDREMLSVRLFDAPRELVWEAWTNPEHLARWWGPKGFTNTFHEFDLRPGGKWRFTMHGPDGTDYENEHVFVEIARPERLVTDHVSPPRFRSTALFEALGDRTRVTWSGLFESPKVFAGVKSFAVPGQRENLEKLAAVLAELRRA